MLESKRLLLIPVDLEMIDALIVSDDFFSTKYGFINNGGEYLNPSPDYLRKIRNRLVKYPEEYPFAVDHLIVVKDIKTVIGTIYYKYLPNNGVSEIGYGMNPLYEGNGYMSEAVNTMIEYARKYGLTKIIADTTIENIKSQNVLKRNGFFLEKTQDNNKMYFYLDIGR